MDSEEGLAYLCARIARGGGAYKGERGWLRVSAMLGGHPKGDRGMEVGQAAGRVRWAVRIA
jgi:hypothetical protein